MWFGSPLNYKPDGRRITTFDVWLQALKTLIPRQLTYLPLNAIVGTIGWELWKERCIAVYDATMPYPALVLNKSLASIPEQSTIQSSIAPLALHQSQL